MKKIELLLHNGLDICMPLTNAERQRRYRERTAQELTRLNVPLNSQAARALDRIVQTTGKTKRTVVEESLIEADVSKTPKARGTSLLHNEFRLSNPEHQRLFRTPEPLCSNDTSLKMASLPEQRTVTGDLDVDACLWLAKVCQTAREPSVLDKVLNAAQRITTPAKEIEERYLRWISQQPGVNAFSAGLSSLGMANIEEKVAAARERIGVYNEGAAIFGSYREAMVATPPEEMIEHTVSEVSDGIDEDFYYWTHEQLTELFARSVNPVTLTEAVTELRYWDWLHHIRWRMQQTESPNEYRPDDLPEVSARCKWVRGLLSELPPQSSAEALQVGEAVRRDLLDEEELTDLKTQATILEHLLRQVANQW